MSLWFNALAVAQDAPAKEEEEETNQEEQAQRGAADQSLDELLGLGSEEESVPAERPESILERLMREEGVDPSDPSALFRAAVDSMGRSAVRLTDHRDPGLTTQRLQEDAIRRLDILIRLAQQQSQQQQQPQPQQQQVQQQESDSGQPQSAEPSAGENPGVDARPPLREGDLDGRIDETRAEWGHLPPRIRDMLRQGRGESASRLYQRLTELYYQRLAEDSEP